MSDFKALDDMLNLTEMLGEADRESLAQSSFRHPFDLSQNHSQAIDYEDDSEDDSPKKLHKV